MTPHFVDFAGKVLVALILWSVLGLAVAMALGDGDAEADFAIAMSGATLTLLAVEIFAAKLAR